MIFATSYGYFDPRTSSRWRRSIPQSCSFTAAGLWDAEKHPKNVCSYFGYSDEPVYVSGVVAAHATKTKKFGYVAAKEVHRVLRNINAFALGARSVDPAITVQVVFTNDWSDSIKEVSATNTLIDNGCDVLTCHVDSPKIVAQTAVKRGAFVCGYHDSRAVDRTQGSVPDGRGMEQGQDLRRVREDGEEGEGGP